MAESRTKNTKRNIFTSYLYMIVTIIFQFLSRTVIVQTLGSEYLGLSSLFTSILQVLSLADLGFAGAITYNLYKPIAENDDVKVCALLEYFKKIYRVVGIIIFTAGVVIMPFIKLFISGNVPADINLYILYFLYLLNTTVSYFLFAYKNTLLEALQRNDIVKNIYTVVSIGQYVLQVVSLLLFKNFYLFVVASILGTMLKNIVGELVSKRLYPRYFCNGSVDGSTKQDIITRVKGLLICNISSKTYTTLDSIIISSFIGLSAVAIYNNYLTIFAAVTTCLVTIRSAMQASVGNKVAVESVERNYQDMFVWQFIFSVLVTWCAACMLCLFQPFMSIWMGEDMLLPMRDVVLFCVWIVVSEVQHAFFLYLSGNGLWWELKWPYILSTVQNLVLNVILGKIFGTTGIIISSLLATFIFGFIWQCIIIFRCYFKRTPVEYYKKQIGYFVVTFIVCVTSYCLCSLIEINGIAGLIIKGIICTAISGVIMGLAYVRLPVFKRTIGLVRKG